QTGSETWGMIGRSDTIATEQRGTGLFGRKQRTGQYSPVPPTKSAPPTTRLRVAVVHGRDWARKGEQRQAEIDALVLQTLGPTGLGDRIDRVDVELVQYAQSLDEMVAASARAKRAKSASVPQFPVAKRVPLVPAVVSRSSCLDCKKLDPLDR